MTTDHQMATMYATQQEVIVALTEVDEVDLAGRLGRCMSARRSRHNGDGWPFTCRSAACVWCRRPMIRSWWCGMSQWAAAATSSLAIVRIDSPTGLSNAVRRLRRGLRDVRDRMARRSRRWRDVGFAGMIGGDGTTLVMVTHQGIDRRGVQDVLCRRWPDVAVKALEQEEPAVAMTAEDAAALGQCRGGVEPLRVAVMPQHDRQLTISPIHRTDAGSCAMDADGAGLPDHPGQC